MSQLKFYGKQCDFIFDQGSHGETEVSLALSFPYKTPPTFLGNHLTIYGNSTYHIHLYWNPLGTVFLIKLTRCTNFTNLFWHEILHVSDSSSVHHQEFIHCTLSNGICRAGPGCNCSSILALLENCLQTCITYTIAECTVNKLLMMDRGIVRNM